MKAILIDSINKEVKEVEMGKGIDEMYKHIGCQIFTIGMHLSKRDAIFVDDEGLMNDPTHFFVYEGAHQPFAGNGLIMGSDSHGNSKDCKIDINEVKKNVKFYDRFELSMAMAFGKIKFS
jgi:hypothetical protein